MKVRLVLLAVLGGVLIFAASGAEPVNPEPELAVLLKEQVEICQRGSDSAMELYKQGSRPYDFVLQWRQRLAQAKLAIATTPAERRAAVQEWLSCAKIFEELTKQRAQSGRGDYMEVTEATYARLQAELALAKLK